MTIFEIEATMKALSSDAHPDELLPVKFARWRSMADPFLRQCHRLKDHSDEELVERFRKVVREANGERRQNTPLRSPFATPKPIPPCPAPTVYQLVEVPPVRGKRSASRRTTDARSSRKAA